MESMSTQAGIRLTSFAKSSKFGKDLYADLVAPGLQAPLLGEYHILILNHKWFDFNTLFLCGNSNNYKPIV